MIKLIENHPQTFLMIVFAICMGILVVIGP
jgi:hypothetical protein